MKHKYADPWSDTADNWNKLGIGNHPSPHDVSVYENFLLEACRGVEKPRIILYGATPELRDMVAKYPDTELTVFDINKNMIEAMRTVMKLEPVNEIYVVGDWLSPPMSNNEYDAIIGDQIRCNISSKDHDKFYSNIHDLLKPSGLHISRITTILPNTKIYSVEEIIEKYSAMPRSKQVFTELIVYLMIQTHNNKISSTDYLFDELEKYLEKPNIKFYYKEVSKIFPRGKEWTIGTPWEEDKVPIEKYFDIVEQVQDDTCFADSSFIAKLKPKSL